MRTNRRFLCALIVITMVLASGAAVFAAGDTVKLFIGKPEAYVNDTKTQIDAGNAAVVPVIQNGRTLVPLRFIGESLNAKVEWNQADQTATLIDDKITVVVKIGASSLSVTSSETKKTESMAIDQSAVIQNGRTLVPLRAISEVFGKYVAYDNAEKSILIQTIGTLTLGSEPTYFGDKGKVGFCMPEGFVLEETFEHDDSGVIHVNADLNLTAGDAYSTPMQIESNRYPRSMAAKNPIDGHHISALVGRTHLYDDGVQEVITSLVIEKDKMYLSRKSLVGTINGVQRNVVYYHLTTMIGDQIVDVTRVTVSVDPEVDAVIGPVIVEMLKSIVTQ